MEEVVSGEATGLTGLIELTDFKLTRLEAAVLNLVARCQTRLGKLSINFTDYSIETDLWYNYCDLASDLNHDSLLHLTEALKTKRLLQQTAEKGELSQTESGKSLNERLTREAEADATARWEDSELCKSFRREAYGAQMQILSRQAYPEDVPLFNMMSEEHAEIFNRKFQALIIPLIAGHKKLNILDFGCGVISRIPELLMQRTEMPESHYYFVDQDKNTRERLRHKHRENRNVTVLESEKDIGPLQLIFAIDVLYFIANHDDRASAINGLFDQLSLGGMLIFSLGAAPKLSPEEYSEKCSEKRSDEYSDDELLSISHPRSGLQKVTAMLSERTDARMEIYAEPYKKSWEKFSLVFGKMPLSRDSALERIRFETDQAMKKIASQKDCPAGRWTVFVEKI